VPTRLEYNKKVNERNITLKIKHMKESVIRTGWNLLQRVEQVNALLDILQPGTLPVSIRVGDGVMDYSGVLCDSARMAQYLALVNLLSELNKEISLL
jgi:hypothetical protein